MDAATCRFRVRHVLGLAVLSAVLAGCGGGGDDGQLPPLGDVDLTAANQESAVRAAAVAMQGGVVVTATGLTGGGSDGGAGVATLLHDLDRVGEVVLVEVANGILRQCLERPHLGQLVATLREERSELFGRAVQGRDEFILHGGLLPALRNRRQPVPGLILADPEGFRQIIRCEGTLDVRDEWCQAWRLLVKRRVAEDGGAAVRFGSAGAPSSPSTNLSYRSRRGPRR